MALTALVVLATLGVADLAVAAAPPGALQVQVINTQANPVPVTGSLTKFCDRNCWAGLRYGRRAGPGTSVMINSTVGDPVRVRKM